MLLFRSRLEARWAAFFDLAGWKWEYEPIDLNGWTPDFRITFPCSHSECSGNHTLLVEVKPYYTIEEFANHPCMTYPYGLHEASGITKHVPADASAAFGIDPSVTYWQRAHGAGGGSESIESWIGSDVDFLWKKSRRYYTIQAVRVGLSTLL